MPVCRCKINPFLAAVTACRTVKVSINTRIGLVKDANKIILHSRLVLHVKAKLTVHGFKLIALFIHNTILFKILPFVKCISCNLNGISFIGFDFTKGIIIKIFDKFWVNGTDEKISL